jgi:membrane protease YdiL (CAAX protease family)
MDHMDTWTTKARQAMGGPPPRGRVSGKLLLVAIGVAATASVVTALVTSKIAYAVAPLWAADPNRLVPLIIAEVYLCIIVALLAVLGRGREGRQARLGLFPTRLRSFGLGLGVWLGAYVTAAVFYVASAPVGGSLTTALEVLWAVGSDNRRLYEASLGIVMVILLRVCVLTPFAEELLFRGALFSWVRSHLSAPWTIAITGVAFGAIHQVPAFLPLAVIVGLGAGWIREKTGSTWVPIAIHAIQNVTVVLASLAVTGWDTTFSMGG